MVEKNKHMHDGKEEEGEGGKSVCVCDFMFAEKLHKYKERDRCSSE